MVPFVKTNSGITFFESGVANMIAKDHVQYSQISQALLNPECTLEEIKALADLTKQFVKWSKGNLRLEEDSKIFYKSQRLPRVLESRLVNMILEKENQQEQAINALLAFIEKLYLNPSKSAVDELFLFLEACDLPITTDGNFLAYKKIRGDYKDIHSGTFDNSVGQFLEVPRNTVDENRRNACSEGLHVCSFKYLEHYSSHDLTDRVVICSIDPADVVCVPEDYSNQKMRVSKYKVVDEIPNDGITQIGAWLSKPRDEGWIRSSIEKIRGILKDAGFKHAGEIKICDPIDNLNGAQQGLLQVAINTTFQISPKEILSEKDLVSISKILKYIEYWSF